ncbi:MAG: diguanylate cyclase [Campylobacterota bacterium]|nr:diguanylate cyclase [Campylobacterota bacterium]
MKIYLLFFIIAIALIYSTFTILNRWHESRLDAEISELKKSAEIQFENQINFRKWNAKYGGVYVKPLPNQKPNPYLKDGTLKVDENLTLIKINPAWMTRQLSEQNTIPNMHFHITSLNPVNPKNSPNSFQKEALEFIEKNKTSSYFKVDSENRRFNYMGALHVNNSCISCHQNYSLGELRGGISVNIDAQNFIDTTNFMSQQIAIRKGAIAFLIIIVLFLIARMINKSKKITYLNRELNKSLEQKSIALNETSVLFQSILDLQDSFLVVTDGNTLIYTNRTLLHFFGFNTIKEFKEVHNCLCDYFQSVENDKEYITSSIDGVTWVDYLLKWQETNELKSKITINGVVHIFKPHAKVLDVNNKHYYLVIFDEITKELRQKSKLISLAMIDKLTQLPNRTSIDIELEKAISNAKNSTKNLSAIFLDLDFFKDVNDKYGHDIGDYVLKEVATILKNSTRENDFVARWGGEEFLVLVEADAKTAKNIANKIRVSIKEYKFEHIKTQTISAGVTQLLSDDCENSFIKRADKALYEAKNSGRDNVYVT